MRARRGFSTWAALSAVMALGILVAVALSSRTTELGFEARTLCRVRARWAAESAIARGRAAGAPTSLSGTLDDSTTYRLSSRQEGATLRLEGTGSCRMNEHQSEISIVARVSPDGRVVGWTEAR